MKVAVDSSFLIPYLSNKNAGGRNARIFSLIDSLRAQSAMIVVPAPVLTEVLIQTPDKQAQFLKALTTKPFQLTSFGARAAVECAAHLRVALTGGQRKQLTKNKIKYDWMIVAIARAESVQHLYHDDSDLVAMCARVGLANTRIDQVPIAPKYANRELNFGDSEVA